MSSSVIFLALVLVIAKPFPPQSLTPVSQSHAHKPLVLPKPAVEPSAGTWKYKSRDDIPGNPDAVNTYSTFSFTIKDDGGSWTVTTAWEFPEGPVTDISTLDKGTLVLRKESFKHFLHPEQPWKPVAVNLDFTANKVSGIMKYVDRQEKPVAVDLSGPLFSGLTELTVACLPLADRYSTSFRYFDIERLALNPHAPDKEKLLELKVAGREPVTVPAGTFDSWKVELTSPDRSYKETVWIAKDSRVPVKTFTVITWKKGARKGTASTTTEMVP